MMGLFEHWPYTNFHDLNLNWIIGKVKRIETAEENAVNAAAAAQQSEEAAQASAEAAQESADNAQDSADTASTEAERTEGTARALRSEMNLLDARMDNILVQGTPTEGNAELIDIRVAANAKIYPTAGDAVRGQISNLSGSNKNMIKIIDRTFTAGTMEITQDAETGTIEIAGDAAANTSPQVYTTGNVQATVHVEAGKLYTLSGCPKGGGGTTYDLDLRRNSSGTILHADHGQGITFLADADETLYVQLRIVAGHGNNLIFKPQLEERSEKTEFVPYEKGTAVDTDARAFIETVDHTVNTILSDGDTVNAMVRCGISYINHNSDLVYGQQTAIHWYENGQDLTHEKLFVDDLIPTQIDCSSLALLVTQGVPYECSRYAIGANLRETAGYGFDLYNGNEQDRSNHVGERTLTYHLAEWCNENGLGFECDGYAGNIKPGDILFFASDGADAGAWKQIDHCEILIDKYCNYPDNMDYPTLVTLNASGSRDQDGVVQFNNRVASFYNGTNESHRKLVYAARLPKGTTANRNKVIYTNPQANVSPAMPLQVDQYKPIFLEFDGTVTVANTHFTVYINETPRATLRNIPANMTNKKLHYRVALSSQWTDCTDVRIRNTQDNAAIIENVYLSDGFNK